MLCSVQQQQQQRQRQQQLCLCSFSVHDVSCAASASGAVQLPHLYTASTVAFTFKPFL